MTNAAKTALWDDYFYPKRALYIQRFGRQNYEDRMQRDWLVVSELTIVPRDLAAYTDTIVRRGIYEYVRAKYTQLARFDELDRAQIPEEDQHERLKPDQLRLIRATISKDLSPEAQAIKRETLKMLHDSVETLSNRHQDIITRFYFEDQTRLEIMDKMKLTSTQYRLLKSRAIGELKHRNELRRKKVVK